MIINIFHITVSILLIISILIQVKGTGLGTTFGGSNQPYHSKRGVEKIVFTSTIILATLFVILSLINIRL